MLTRFLYGIGISLLTLCLNAGDVWGQQDVFSRSESNNGNWGDGEPYPWFWDGLGDLGDPDDDGN
ncbi:MAG: hypothetical protein ABR574_01270, partial [Cryomorphaceae bacterium]